MAAEPKKCIYPGCDRPAVPPHPLGGPQPAFCDLEEHNALTTYQERQRLERDDPQRDDPQRDDPERDDPERDDPERDDPERQRPAHQAENSERNK